jgi:hypothetical protein
LVLMIPSGIASIWLCGWLLVNTPHPSKNREIFPTTHREEEQQKELM